MHLFSTTGYARMYTSYILAPNLSIIWIQAFKMKLRIDLCLLSHAAFWLALSCSFIYVNCHMLHFELFRVVIKCSIWWQIVLIVLVLLLKFNEWCLIWVTYSIWHVSYNWHPTNCEEDKITTKFYIKAIIHTFKLWFKKCALLIGLKSTLYSSKPFLICCCKIRNKLINVYH